jgi:hypothetical protein
MSPLNRVLKETASPDLSPTVAIERLAANDGRQASPSLAGFPGTLEGMTHRALSNLSLLYEGLRRPARPV